MHVRNVRGTVHGRRAFTLLELIVSIAVIIILLSLLLMGLSQVRESFRRLACSDRLRQIGIGLQNYNQAHRSFPKLVLTNSSGPLVAILPFVEKNDVYSTIDFGLQFIEDNNHLMHLKIDLYRCPATEAQERARTDYVFNRGTTLGPKRNGPWMDEEINRLSQYPKSSSWSRGSSNTAIMSETCPLTETRRAGTIWELPRQMRLGEDRRGIVDHCIELTTFTPSHLDNGYSWVGLGVASYYHILRPNERSCSHDDRLQTSLFTPVSMHSGGVNILFADGHVMFESNSVELDVWKGIGTR
ncbi:DUF1559 domain-containing protein [Pirellulaceae bacterium SH449]